MTLKISDACKLAGLHRNVVYRALRLGQLQAARGKDFWAIDPTDFAKFLISYKPRYAQRRIKQPV